jgi:hypothetical protein
MTTTTTFDTAALTAAVAGRDARGQLAAYAPDAELTVVDHEHPPSRPLVLRGAGEIGPYLAGVAARDMTHEVRTAALAGDRLTVEVACGYADGTRVACLSVAGVRDGRIAWQHQIQAWDH